MPRGKARRAASAPSGMRISSVAQTMDSGSASPETPLSKAAVTICESEPAESVRPRNHTPRRAEKIGSEDDSSVMPGGCLARGDAEDRVVDADGRARERDAARVSKS